MPAHKNFSDSEDDDDVSAGSGSDGERAGVCRRASPNLLVVGLAITVICLLALELHRRSAEALAGGVENAWRTCSGEGRPGGPAPDLHLHFLFMLGQGLPHLDVWQRFFEGAPRGSYNVWVHCQSADPCRASFAQRGLADFVVVPTVYSAWCEDLVSPMVQLLRTALNASALVPAKFVFVSESTLPLKPFEVIRAELGKHPAASDFCVFPTNYWNPARNKSVYMVKASQWSVLSQMDAQVFVERLPAPSPDTAMAFPPISNLTCTDFGGCSCPDEMLVFGTIFGLYDPSLEPNTFPGIGPLMRSQPAGSPFEQGCCRTWLMFDSPGHPELAWVIDMEKKVSVMGNLYAELLGESSSNLSAPFTHEIEALVVIHALGPQGLRALRGSPFLFARKFDSAAPLPGFAEVMFAG